MSLLDVPGSPRLLPSQSEALDHVDIAHMLESPTAIATQCNLYASLLGPYPMDNHDTLFGQASLGSPDFSNQLNMAGFFDCQQQPSSEHLLRQLSGGLLLPELVLQSQPATNHATHRLAASADRLSLLGQSNKEFNECAQQEHPEGHHHQLNALGPVLVQQVATASQQVSQPPMQLTFPNCSQAEKVPEQQQQQCALPEPTPMSIDVPAAEQFHVGGVHPAAAAAVATAAAAAAPPVLNLLTAPGLQLKPLQTRQQPWQQSQPVGLKRGHSTQRQHGCELAAQCEADSHLHQQPSPPHHHHQQQQQVLHVEMEAGDDVTSIPGAKRLKSAAARAPSGKAAQAAASSSAASVGADRLVWAKVSRFPWWPAVIVCPSDPTARDAAAAAPDGCCDGGATVLVRFFGTHDGAWLDPSRALSPWDMARSERSSKTKASVFVQALAEAKQFLATGELPKAFSSPLQLTSVATPVSAALKAKKQRRGGDPGGRASPTATLAAAAAAARGGMSASEAAQVPAACVPAKPSECVAGGSLQSFQVHDDFGSGGSTAGQSTHAATNNAAALHSRAALQRRSVRRATGRPLRP